MLEVINEYLSIERLTSGAAALNLRPLELTPLVERAIEGARGLGAKDGIALELAVPLPGVKVNADPDRLVQVLTNLVSNAVKFSPPGAVVKVALSRNEGFVRVSVADRGPGVPEDFRGKI